MTEHRACQIQMWHGQRASWVLPVCSPLPNLELSVGFIAVWEDGGEGHFEYVLQAKTLLKALGSDGWGVAFVAGTGRDPALASTSEKLSTVYAYVPVSASLSGGRVVFHQNTGWLLQRQAGRDRHALTWASRADVRLGGRLRRLTVIAEAYGAEGAAGAASEFQVGLRASPRPDRVQVDVSYGGVLRTGRRAAGWTVGLTLLTPPFL